MMEEENIRKLRSSRSRSNTPFVRVSRDRDGIHTSVEGNVISSSQVKRRQKGGSRQKSNLISVTESHTSEVSVTTHKHRKSGNESDSSIEHVIEDKQKAKKQTERQTKHQLLVNGTSPQKESEMTDLDVERKSQRKQSKLHKTSDYSSDDGESVAYQVYKEAGDWWNKFPKTDYTYSPKSPHRKEVAPGIIAMPNMSRQSLNSVRHHYTSGIASSSAALKSTTISTHREAKSRWFDPSTSGSQASKKVLEDWAAVDSDVDDVAEAFKSRNVKYTQKSSSVTTVITSFFITIWTYITTAYTYTIDAAYRLVGSQRNTNIYATPHRGVSPVRENGIPYWIQRFLDWLYPLMCSVMRIDTLLLSYWHSNKLEKKEEEEIFEETEYSESDNVSKSLNSHKHNIWRLLLLLLPLLFLAGWWSISEASDFSITPLVESLDTAWNKCFGWALVPFEVLYSLKDSMLLGWSSFRIPIIITSNKTNEAQQQQTVDMETISRYIIASEQFQELLRTQIHMEAETAQEEKGEMKATFHQYEDMHKLNSKVLEEQRILLSQLTVNLQKMQDKLDQISSESEDFQVREEAWKTEWMKERKLEKEKILIDSDTLLLQKELRDLQARLRLLQEQQTIMMRRCCQRVIGHATVSGSLIEEHVLKVLADLLGATGGQFSGRPEQLRAWVSNVLMARHDVEEKLANLTASLSLQTRETVKRSREVILATVAEHIQGEFAKWQEQEQQHDVKTTISNNMETWSTNNSYIMGLSDLQVRAIVDEALAKYDADKTGLVDYALESSGGSIISTRCTETYQAKTALLSMLGIPIWYPSNNPRTVIQPGVHPGECWAFSGSQGFLVIHLSGVVQVSGFSLEHIPRSLSPHGRIDSAPKDFTVWALKDVQDPEPILLGKYSYRQNGTSLQNFNVQRLDADPVELVELRIESNHGNIDYTCLYRFRVHGILLSK